MTESIDARAWLISQGFKPGARGRYSKEMLKALQDSGLTFTKPVKVPKERTASVSTPLA